VFLNNRPVETDYGYRAVHLTALIAKSLIKANQGKTPDYSYFNGCSTGGRQALMEAQRYPEDFDGVVAGSPALQLTGLAIEQNWSMRKFYENSFAGNIFGKTSIVTAAAKAACADSEGIFSNPACTYDPTPLACPVGVDNATCLTPAQMTAVKEVYRGPHSSTGTPWYPGKPIGSEASWASWIVGDPTVPSAWNPLQGGFGFSFVNNLFFETDPPSTYNWYDFNFDVDPPKQTFMAQILNATNPDLSKFNARKGKLIVYHGTGDGLIGYQPTQNYMDSVHRFMGQPNVDPFARMFLVHGMDHCDFFDRGGLAVSDWMAPLVNWVEKGQAPDSIPGKSRASATPAFTRPICAYPKLATYKGTGSRLDAANWSCTP
jgi:feruloyl esterase